MTGIEIIVTSAIIATALWGLIVLYAPEMQP